jgi:hypothetical protein
MICKGICNSQHISSSQFESICNVPFTIRCLCHLILVYIPLSSCQGLATGQRRHTINEHILGRIGRLLESLCQTSLGFLLDSHELLLTSFTDELDLGSRSAADSEELGELGLVDDAKLGVVSAVVALPVGVVGDVAGGQRNGVVVLERRVGAGWRVSEVRVQRDTVGSLRVNGHEATEGLPYARRLEGLLLYDRDPVSGCIMYWLMMDVRGNSNVGAAVERPLGGIGFGGLFMSRTLAMLTTLLAALAAWDDMMAVVGG